MRFGEGKMALVGTMLREIALQMTSLPSSNQQWSRPWQLHVNWVCIRGAAASANTAVRLVTKNTIGLETVRRVPSAGRLSQIDTRGMVANVPSAPELAMNSMIGPRSVRRARDAE